MNILILQSSARDAIDDVDMLQQELEMLAVRQDLMQQSQSRGSDVASSSSYMPDLPGPTPDPSNRPGISVTRTFKAGDQLILSRDTVKASVFGPGIAPPSMTLAEFGDLQRAEAERAASQAQSQEQPQGPRRYKDLSEEEKDDMALLDQATIEDRKWDDWKDNHQKGSGNKLNKRF